MFGTFTLFNFLQQPNTGVVPAKDTYDVGSIIRGDGKAGTVSEMNWPFPYAGTATPFEIVEGGGAVFQIKLFSDSDVGLDFPTVQTVISGSFFPDTETSPAYLIISGSFFPKDSDVATQNLVFSGNLTGSPNENATNYLVFSGQFVSDIPDFNYSQLLFSGSVNPDAPDAPPLQSIISGDFTSGKNELSRIKAVLSGKFLPVNSDYSNISYKMLSFSGIANKIISNVEFDEDCGVQYGFNSYFSTHG